MPFVILNKMLANIFFGTFLPVSLTSFEALSFESPNASNVTTFENSQAYPRVALARSVSLSVRSLARLLN